MKITIITRHNSTIDIIKNLINSGKLDLPKDVDFDIIPHLTNIDDTGNIIIGILPIPIIKDVINSGKQFYLFTLNNIPPNMRGKDLSMDDIKNIGFSIYKITDIIMDKII